MTEEKDQLNKSVMRIGKRHSVLQNITKQLQGHELQNIVEYGDHKFLISTLSSDEELWADGLTQINTPTQAITSFRLSRVAACIKMIDGVDVAELFEFPDDMPEEEKKEMTGSKYGERTWQMSQLMIWLGDQPIDMIETIAEKYNELNKKRKETLGVLKNSSARTPGGESKATFSPERESSQATQM